MGGSSKHNPGSASGNDVGVSGKVAAYEATSHVGAARPTGKVVEPLPRDVDCRRGNKGERDLEWVVFFVVDDILLEGVRSDVQSAEHFSSGRVFAGNG